MKKMSRLAYLFAIGMAAHSAIMLAEPLGYALACMAFAEWIYPDDDNEEG